MVALLGVLDKRNLQNLASPSVVARELRVKVSGYSWADPIDGPGAVVDCRENYGSVEKLKRWLQTRTKLKFSRMEPPGIAKISSHFS